MSHSSNSIFASFLLQSSRKMYGFSLSHLISSCFENNFFFLGLSLWFEMYYVRTCSCLDCSNMFLLRYTCSLPIVEGEELKCWVRRKSFSVSPAYLAEMMIYVQMSNCLGMVLDKTWNSHPMETQSACPLALIN